MTDEQFDAAEHVSARRIELPDGRLIWLPPYLVHTGRIGRPDNERKGWPFWCHCNPTQDLTLDEIRQHVGDVEIYTSEEAE